ncbi:MAG: ORF6N domain-containing protein [Gammaproteobacteria bacterium]|nr:ORF6N domain-containing protein [Gammaproteobacteria bacterium]
MVSSRSAALVPVEHITQSILVMRGQKVLLDAELAALYGVSTKRLNEQVKRNAARFPEDFLFRLRSDEVEALNRSHFATGSQKHRDPRFPPYAFTEHGAIMAASILNSPRAVEMSVYVVRAFVRLRDLLASNTALARKLDELERKYQHHDDTIKAILSAIRELMNPPQAKRRPIGFTADLSKKS